MGERAGKGGVVPLTYDYDYIPLALIQSLKLWTSPVGRIAFLEHRATAGTEVGHLVLVAQEDLKLPGVGVISPARVDTGCERSC